MNKSERLQQLIQDAPPDSQFDGRFVEPHEQPLTWREVIREPSIIIHRSPLLKAILFPLCIWIGIDYYFNPKTPDANKLDGTFDVITPVDVPHELSTAEWTQDALAKLANIKVDPRMFNTTTETFDVITPVDVPDELSTAEWTQDALTKYLDKLP